MGFGYVPDILCPICGKEYLVEDPNDWRDFVNPPGGKCKCDLKQIVYIATDSDPIDGIAVSDGYGDVTDVLSVAEINQMLGTNFETDVHVYYPIKAKNLIDDAVATWYEGCDCFSEYQEPGCLSCAIESIRPVEIHLSTWDGKTNTREHVVGFVGDELSAFDDTSLSHGALWNVSSIPPTRTRWSSLERIINDPYISVINRKA